MAGPAARLSHLPQTRAGLRAQARAADCLAEQLHLLTGIISAWTGRLTDRLADASWGTEQITAEADALTGAGEDLGALTDRLAELARACEAAIAVGTEAAAAAATGAAERFQTTPAVTGQEPTMSAASRPLTGADPPAAGLAGLVAEYDRLARHEPVTRHVDQRLSAVVTKLRDAGVDVDGYLTAATDRLAGGGRYLTLAAHLRTSAGRGARTRHQNDPGEGPGLPPGTPDRLVALLLSGLARTGHRQAILDTIRHHDGDTALADVMQSEITGNALIRRSQT